MKTESRRIRAFAAVCLLSMLLAAPVFAQVAPAKPDASQQLNPLSPRFPTRPRTTLPVMPGTAGGAPTGVPLLPSAPGQGVTLSGPPGQAPAPSPALPATGAVIGASPGPLKGGEEKYVGLNFDYADINVVIQTIADLIGLNYILAPGISGKVTIQTSGKIAISDLFFILEKILEVNKLTAVKSGDFYKIMPLSEGRQKPMEIVPDGKELPDEDRTVIKIFKLKNVVPTQMMAVLNSIKAADSIFVPYDPSSLLIVVDNAARLRMVSEVVAILDVDVYQDIKVTLYPVANAQVEDLARDLNQVLSTVAVATGRNLAKSKLLPIKNINAILFVTAEPTLDAMLQHWIQELDQPATMESEKIFVYHLNHATAENIAGILKDLYGSTGGTSNTTSSSTTTPRTPPQINPAPGNSPMAEANAAARVAAAATAAATRPRDGGAEVSGKVKIVADKDTNSLVIQTAPWNYPAILETIKRLDTPPKQVLIEVTVAEITLDDADQFGLEWALLSQGSVKAGSETFNLNARAQNITSGLTMRSGFSYMVSEAGRVAAVLNAYAKASKLNIISSPHIMASDNKEAKIDVGQDVPIVTTETQSGDTTTNVDKTIQYRSTGVILTVTPHINDERTVTLDVSQEVSEAQTNNLSGTDSPIIRKRNAKTTVVVRDNDTLVIGGLIQTKRERSREGIPFLSRLPILGYLFGTTTDTVSKTELILLITPRVITNADEGDKLSNEYIGRVHVLKERAPQGKQEGME